MQDFIFFLRVSRRQLRKSHLRLPQLVNQEYENAARLDAKVMPKLVGESQSTSQSHSIVCQKLAKTAAYEQALTQQHTEHEVTKYP